MNEKYIKILFSLAKKAYKKDEIPVGALIVKNNKIISKAYNNRQNKYDVTGHAEIICIKKAAKKLHDWRLDDCILYVSLEPCEMCKKIIEESRIKNVYFIEKSTYNNKHNFINYEQLNDKNDNFASLLKQFFENRR